MSDGGINQYTADDWDLRECPKGSIGQSEADRNSCG